MSFFTYVKNLSNLRLKNLRPPSDRHEGWPCGAAFQVVPMARCRRFQTVYVRWRNRGRRSQAQRLASAGRHRGTTQAIVDKRPTQGFASSEDPSSHDSPHHKVRLWLRQRKTVPRRCPRRVIRSSQGTQTSVNASLHPALLSLPDLCNLGGTTQSTTCNGA